jgi:hypothetical protein
LRSGRNAEIDHYLAEPLVGVELLTDRLVQLAERDYSLSQHDVAESRWFFARCRHVYVYHRRSHYQLPDRAACVRSLERRAMPRCIIAFRWNTSL